MKRDDLARVEEALRQAALDTYGDHEQWTSDMATKRRVANAAWQVHARAMALLEPEPRRQRVWRSRLAPWKGSLGWELEFGE